MESYKKTFKLGEQEVILESGKIARQATGAVVATSGDTQVLATVVVGKAPENIKTFFRSQLIIKKRLMQLEKYQEVFLREKEGHQKKRP